ncbi:hypothetical protein BDV35DRAFT_384363 [Aspergillus flavus]|uniref:DNA, SC003 n=3 Tax=Aspergillus subgen. Circumdati TaxID=2720871 RepID=Q2UMB3_ASPOR|nr:unnamed protein product [Aspergillus oryzae RIB40]EIT72806.1 hypothetical protein Ao3042_00906 [Aspergillus oryzae 3.042]KAB8242033.1 hypothetical protein BDV35DRAFT_384363 [Aspergillus flavus]KDE83535.1 hypothetical protein AO1008_10068 [Aspergillus oryzae 100-8]BAE57302.1 unnamed protein product [Aspergillus oryzae RIB40]|eukprot:EIT72806.1 hypothetical protein Ao3042_00906 [Aspergillus oryzae 3.042]
MESKGIDVTRDWPILRGLLKPSSVDHLVIVWRERGREQMMEIRGDPYVHQGTALYPILAINAQRARTSTPFQKELVYTDPDLVESFWNSCKRLNLLLSGLDW